jgi:hypothetical protein
MLTALACAAAYPWVLAIEVVSLRRTSKFSRRLSPCSVRQLLMNYTNFTFIQPFFNLISKHMKIVNQSRSVFQSHCLYGRFVNCKLHSVLVLVCSRNLPVSSLTHCDSTMSTRNAYHQRSHTRLLAYLFMEGVSRYSVKLRFWILETCGAI